MVYHHLTIPELRKLVLEESKKLIKGLEDNVSWESLAELRDNIRKCGQLIDLKISDQKSLRKG